MWRLHLFFVKKIYIYLTLLKFGMAVNKDLAFSLIKKLFRFSGWNTRVGHGNAYRHCRKNPLFIVRGP